MEGKTARENGAREREGTKTVLTWQSSKILIQINTKENSLGQLQNFIWSQVCSFFFFGFFFCPLLCICFILSCFPPLFFSLFYSFYVIRGCRSLVFPRILVKMLLASGRQRMAGVRKAMKQKSWIILIIWVFLGNADLWGLYFWVFLPLKFAFTQENGAWVKTLQRRWSHCLLLFFGPRQLDGIRVSKKFLANRGAAAWGPRLENQNPRGKKVF